MGRVGIANLPLHIGTTPRWLFRRMVNLSESVVTILINEYGTEEFLRRISDPFWFQAFSNLIGFDWHSSGTTTVTCGVLKLVLTPENHGVAIAGGKGKVSRRTLQELDTLSEKFDFSTSTTENLKYSSRMSAKVDTVAIQDGYTLYHHVIFVTENKKWAVVQQGMNLEKKYARRYHWLSDNLKSFVNEPHTAIVCDYEHYKTLDMTSAKSENCRKTCVDLVNDLNKNSFRIASKTQKTLDHWTDEIKVLTMPVTVNWDLLKKVYDIQPDNYEELLGIKGVGAKTVRALALVSELVYGASPSWKDPVKYSFTVGGKDGVPYPVDKKVMDDTIEILRQCIKDTKISNKDKLVALKNLNFFAKKEKKIYKFIEH
jgi:hypothetical protein